MPALLTPHIDPHDEAICLGHDEDLDESRGSIMPPIVQTSLFAHPSLEELFDSLDAEHANAVYTRGQNPTVAVLERKLAALERGERCKCFASGMAAVSAVFMGLLGSGDHVLFVNNIYGPTLQLAKNLERFGIEHDLVLDTDLQKIESRLRSNTKLIFFESPGTMLFRVIDFQKLVALARKRDILTAMDNTWATPLFQKPLTLGVDIVVHSATKYIGGHSDVVAGAVVSSEALMQRIFYNAFMLNGGILSPFDAWLLIRGLRTLPVRMRQHHQDGLQVAGFLRQHAGVAAVFHPAFDGQAQTLVERSLTGYSSLFSFQLATSEFGAVCRFVDALRLFRIGVSWGGVESLVISPNRVDNQAALAAHNIPPGTIRISVGLEGAEALILDLDQALVGLAV